MVVVQNLPSATENVWYLAYGSNILPSKFFTDRGIVALDVDIVRVPYFTLIMDTPGVPYREPSFASICPFQPDVTQVESTESERGDFQIEKHGQVTLMGTAYLVTTEQYKRILASEGGGIAYREVEVWVESVAKSNRAQNEIFYEDVAASMPVKRVARTLISVRPRHPAPRPSLRYMVRWSSSKSGSETNSSTL